AALAAIAAAAVAIAVAAPRPLATVALVPRLGSRRPHRLLRGFRGRSRRNRDLRCNGGGRRGGARTRPAAALGAPAIAGGGAGRRGLEARLAGGQRALANRDRLLHQLLDLGEVLLVLRQAERDRLARPPGASRPTDAVDVVLRM